MKTIPELGGRYEITESGEVYSIISKKFLKPQIIKGYKSIVLRVGGKHKRFQINRLVFSAFHGPIKEGQQVGHLDGNRINNHFSNLRAMSQLCNEAFKIDHGTLISGEDCHTSKITEKDAVEIVKLREGGMQFKDIVKRFPVNIQTASRICSGLIWREVTGLEYKRNRKNLTKEEWEEVYNLYLKGSRKDFLCKKFNRSKTSINHIIRSLS